MGAQDAMAGESRGLGSVRVPEPDVGGETGGEAMSVWNGRPRLDGVRVLLVEDVPEVRDAVAGALGGAARV
jgi:hypothetical protein